MIFAEAAKIVLSVPAEDNLPQAIITHNLHKQSSLAARAVKGAGGISIPIYYGARPPTQLYARCAQKADGARKRNLRYQSSLVDSGVPLCVILTEVRESGRSGKISAVSREREPSAECRRLRLLAR